jgi:hypothetical protein
MASGVRTEESAFLPIASGVTVYGPRALVYHKRMTKEKADKKAGRFPQTIIQ